MMMMMMMMIALELNPWINAPSHYRLTIHWTCKSREK